MTSTEKEKREYEPIFMEIIEFGTEADVILTSGNGTEETTSVGVDLPIDLFHS